MKATEQSIIALVFLFTIGCVQKTHQKIIHFKLDMTAFQNPVDVGVRGEFGIKGWEETIYFTDENNDGIFEGTVKFQTAKNALAFKFVEHGDQFELEGQDNRSISFIYKPETILYEAVFNNHQTKK